VCYEVDGKPFQGKPFQYWFHVEHGEVQKLSNSEIDMKDFQLTPRNEKIISEWRTQKIAQWENKGKLAQKYPSREKLDLWLDAQCLRASEQLFKKQREQQQQEQQQNATIGKLIPKGGDNNDNSNNMNTNANLLANSKPVNVTQAGNVHLESKKTTAKARRRNRKAKDREAAKGFHAQQNHVHPHHEHGHDYAYGQTQAYAHIRGNQNPRNHHHHPHPNNPGKCQVCDDVFKGIDLDKIDFESVALGPDGQARKEGKNRRKVSKSQKKSGKPEPLDLPKLMASHRAKAKVLKGLRDRLSRLSKSLANMMVSNQTV